MPDEPRSAEDEGFISRWSRRKTEAREAPRDEAPVTAGDPQSDEAPPDLPPVSELTMESDFRGFLHPKVDEDLRRSALRKLFSDPHFNVMDGLDVYIDDYSKTEPIPPEMLAGLKQAQRIFRWAEGKEDEEDSDGAPPDSPEAAVAVAPAVDDAAPDTSAIEAPAEGPADLCEQREPIGSASR